jgi:hypothetical protein
MLIVPAVGETKLLEFMLGKSVPGNQTLHLYLGDTAITDTVVAGDFLEMSTLGYASKSLTKANWVIAQDNNVALATYAEQSWTFTGGSQVSVYGYFIKDTTTGVLLWAERFVQSKDILNNGDVIRITPKITLSKLLST